MSNHLTNLKLNLTLLVQTAKVNVILKLTRSRIEKLNLMLKLSSMLTLIHGQNLTEIRIDYLNCFQMKTLNLIPSLILKLMQNLRQIRKLRLTHSTNHVLKLSERLIHLLTNYLKLILNLKFYLNPTRILILILKLNLSLIGILRQIHLKSLFPMLKRIQIHSQIHFQILNHFENYLRTQIQSLIDC